VGTALISLLLPSTRHCLALTPPQHQAGVVSPSISIDHMKSAFPGGRVKGAAQCFAIYGDDLSGDDLSLCVLMQSLCKACVHCCIAWEPGKRRRDTAARAPGQRCRAKGCHHVTSAPTAHAAKSAFLSQNSPCPQTSRLQPTQHTRQEVKSLKTSVVARYFCRAGREPRQNTGVNRSCILVYPYSLSNAIALPSGQGKRIGIKVRPRCAAGSRHPSQPFFFGL
jgi:hypothetical protein